MMIYEEGSIYFRGGCGREPHRMTWHILPLNLCHPWSSLCFICIPVIVSSLVFCPKCLTFIQSMTRVLPERFLKVLTNPCSIYVAIRIIFLNCRSDWVSSNQMSFRSSRKVSSQNTRTLQDVFVSSLFLTSTLGPVLLIYYSAKLLYT